MLNLTNQKVVTFLAFSGNAKEAMIFYESVLPNVKIESLNYFSEEHINGDTGKVLNGVLNIGGQKIMFMDMDIKNPAPNFTWSTSLLINCSNEEEFDEFFIGLSTNGMVMMGPEPVMSMRKCAWVTDQFGLTWQLVWC